MIDLNNKSKEEMLREKAEADLWYAKRQEWSGGAGWTRNESTYSQKFFIRMKEVLFI